MFSDSTYVNYSHSTESVISVDSSERGYSHSFNICESFDFVKKIYLKYSVTNNSNISTTLSIPPLMIESVRIFCNNTLIEVIEGISLWLDILSSLDGEILEYNQQDWFSYDTFKSSNNIDSSETNTYYIPISSALITGEIPMFTNRGTISLKVNVQLVGTLPLEFSHDLSLILHTTDLHSYVKADLATQLSSTITNKYNVLDRDIYTLDIGPIHSGSRYRFKVPKLSNLPYTYLILSSEIDQLFNIDKIYARIYNDSDVRSNILYTSDTLLNRLGIYRINLSKVRDNNSASLTLISDDEIECARLFVAQYFYSAIVVEYNNDLVVKL